MADTSLIIKSVLGNEGWKLTNEKEDAGQRSYAGISERWNKGWKGWQKINELGLKPGDHHSSLDSYVIDFYEKSEYILKTRAKEIVSQEVARKLVDDAVNLGVIPAIKMWQSVIGVKETGIMDDHTLQTTNDQNKI